MRAAWALLKRYWPLMVGLLVLVAFYHWADSRGYERADRKWAVEWQKRDAADAALQLLAEQDARAEEQRRVNAAQQVQAHAAQEIEKARTDADTAAAASGQLRDQLAKLQARLRSAGGAASTLAACAPVTRAAGVLSDLLKRADQRAGVLASLADQARIRGLTCEAAYDSLEAK